MRPRSNAFSAGRIASEDDAHNRRGDHRRRTGTGALKKTVAKPHDEESLLTVGSLTKALLQRKMGDRPQKGTPEPEKKIWTSTS